jgi:hypothetical protein
MLRELTVAEMELVSGGANSDHDSYDYTFDNVNDFSSWLMNVEQALIDQSVSVDIADGDGWNLSAYANFDLANLSVNQVGVTLTVNF